MNFLHRKHLGWILSLLFVVTIGGLAFFAHPIYQWGQDRYATRLLDQAFTFLENDQPADALGRAMEAYQLSPQSPRINRYFAEVNFYANPEKCLFFYDKLKVAGALEPLDEVKAILAQARIDKGAALARLAEYEASGRVVAGHGFFVRGYFADVEGRLDEALELYWEAHDSGVDLVEVDLLAARIALEQGSSYWGGAPADRLFECGDFSGEGELYRGRHIRAIASSALALAELGEEDEARFAQLVDSMDSAAPPRFLARVFDHRLGRQEGAAEKLAMIRSDYPFLLGADPVDSVYYFRVMLRHGLSAMVLEAIDLEAAMLSLPVFAVYLDALSAEGRYDDIRSMLAAEDRPLSIGLARVARGILANEETGQPIPAVVTDRQELQRFFWQESSTLADRMEALTE